MIIISHWDGLYACQSTQMGIKMDLWQFIGIKKRKIKFQDNYTIGELYDRIKDVPFEAGMPAMVNQGCSWLIVFPRLDSNNQVQILPSGKEDYVVFRSVTPVGVGHPKKHKILNALKRMLKDCRGATHKKKKRCMELTEKTAQTINALGL